MTSHSLRRQIRAFGVGEAATNALRDAQRKGGNRHIRRIGACDPGKTSEFKIPYPYILIILMS